MTTMARMARSLGALSLVVACSQAAAEPVFAIALGYSGWDIWDGNDQLSELAKDDPSRFPGAPNAIKDAVARADLAHKAPAGRRPWS